MPPVAGWFIIIAMSRDLPDSIAVEPRFGGVMFVMPSREIGPLRWVGRGLMAFGVLVLAIVGVLLGVYAAGMGRGDWLQLIAYLPGVFIGLIPLAIGLLISRGRTHVHLDGDQIRISERAGPVFYRWKRRVDDITRLEVITAGPEARYETNASPKFAALGDLGAIRMVCEHGKDLIIAPAYHAQLLAPLAEAIADRIESDTHRRPQVVSIVGELSSVRERRKLAYPDDEPPPDQPADSKITVEPRSDGATFYIPPLGMSPGATAVLVMGIFLIVIGIPFVLVLLGFLFIGLGVVMIVTALKTARRSAIIDIVGDVLLISSSGLFGARQQEWHADDIHSIVAGPSGTRINDKHLYELQIRPRTGGKIGHFEGRDTPELRWLAGRLREELGLITKKRVDRALDE